MNKQNMLSPLYEQGKIKLAFGYSSRIAKRYYKTKQPTESQRDTIRKMLNPNMRLKCSSVVLHLALKDLNTTAKQHLEVSLTLRSEQAQVKATNAQTQKVLEEVTNG